MYVLGTLEAAKVVQTNPRTVNKECLMLASEIKYLVKELRSALDGE